MPLRGGYYTSLRKIGKNRERGGLHQSVDWKSKRIAISDLEITVVCAVKEHLVFNASLGIVDIEGCVVAGADGVRSKNSCKIVAIA